MKNLQFTLLPMIVMSFLMLFCLSSCNNEELLSELVQSSIIEEVVVEETIVEETPTPEPEPQPEPEPEPIPDDEVSTLLKAFPNAYGAASNVTGGRGGKVIHVTNLNDSGAGSFREAFQTSGARIIVFDVSGTINCLSSLKTSSGNVTVAGQTAPQGGITFAGNVGNSPLFAISGRDNMIFRYIRVRPNYYYNATSAGNSDAFQLYSCTNVIVDNCSISWGGDEALSATGASGNISIQNNFIAESKTGSITLSTNGGNFSYNGNVFFQVDHRFPNPSTDGRIDMINNVIYGYGNRTMRTSTPYGTYMNEINCFYISNSARILGDMGKYDYEGTVPQIYSKGNLHLPTTVTDPNLANNNNTWTAFSGTHQGFTFTYNSVNYYDDDMLPSAFYKATPHTQLGASFTPLTALESFAKAKTDIGANRYLNANGTVTKEEDAIDSYYQSHMVAGTRLSMDIDPAGKSHYTTFLSKVSSTPINTRVGNYDSDKDGMPDVWEVAKGFNPNNASDANGDADGDGYTNLEEFLNLVDMQ